VGTHSKPIRNICSSAAAETLEDAKEAAIITAKRTGSRTFKKL
jgi:hypothetical protein